MLKEILMLLSFTSNPLLNGINTTYIGYCVNAELILKNLWRNNRKDCVLFNNLITRLFSTLNIMSQKKYY